jgi:hypothetical protein
MHRLVLPCLLLCLCACLPDLDPQDSPEGDTDSDADADSDADSDADADAQPVVLVDEDGFLPGPQGYHDYVDFEFDVFDSIQGEWVHIELSSEEAPFMYGILTGPFEGCALEVPSFGWPMDTHTNQGWLQLNETGHYVLTIFGNSADSHGEIHVRVATIPDHDDIPDAILESECSLDDDACTCEQRTCNCEPLR